MGKPTETEFCFLKSRHRQHDNENSPTDRQRSSSRSSGPSKNSTPDAHQQDYLGGPQINVVDLALLRPKSTFLRQAVTRKSLSSDVNTMQPSSSRSEEGIPVDFLFSTSAGPCSETGKSLVCIATGPFMAIDHDSEAPAPKDGHDWNVVPQKKIKRLDCRCKSRAVGSTT